MNATQVIRSFSNGLRLGVGLAAMIAATQVYADGHGHGNAGPSHGRSTHIGPQVNPHRSRAAMPSDHRVQIAPQSQQHPSRVLPSRTTQHSRHTPGRHTVPDHRVPQTHRRHAYRFHNHPRWTHSQWSPRHGRHIYFDRQSRRGYYYSPAHGNFLSISRCPIVPAPIYEPVGSPLYESTYAPELYQPDGDPLGSEGVPEDEPKMDRLPPLAP